MESNFHEKSIIGAEYIRGLNIDTPLAMRQGRNNYYYHRNHQDSIIALSDSTGSIVQRYAYDSFGNIDYIDKDGNKTLSPTIANAFTYTAREHDADAGMYYYRARWYNPSTGRFLSPDPIGFGGGDFNLYRYVNNNPVNYVDPDGETPKAALYAFGLGVGIGAVINKVFFDIDFSETLKHFNPVLILIDKTLPGTTLLASKEGQSFVQEILLKKRSKRFEAAFNEAVRTGTSRDAGTRKPRCQKSN